MSNKSGNILIVDDSSINRKLLSAILIMQGYEITEAADGREALVKANSESPDLILLDVNMPEMSGYDVCAELKRNTITKDIPVIFVTALETLWDRIEGFSLGGVDYIHKPFENIEVLARVDTHIQLRQLQKQLYRRAESLEIQNTILQNEIRDRLGVEQEFYKDLEFACEREELKLCYQPIINFNTNRILGFEALVRWVHPKYGVIAPDRFIPFAECTGLINPMGEWILNTALSQIAQWNKSFNNSDRLSISVNVSANQLLNNSLVSFTQRALREHDVTCDQLKLEITESLLVNDPDATVEVLQQFKDLGIELHIDDFGTGYSSLSRLDDFPIDVLKIDRAFIKNGRWAIVKAIVQIAAAMNKGVIVEGVETLEQLISLKNLSCSQGQGYYFSKPVDAQTATNLVEEDLKKV
jgi:diguanylate cyclase